jgi:hypothetical protein
MRHIDEANDNVRRAKRELHNVELENARLRIEIQNAKNQARSLYLEPLASSYRGRGTRGRGQGPPPRYFDVAPAERRQSRPEAIATTSSTVQSTTPMFEGAYYDELPDSESEIDELFTAADDPTNPLNRKAIHRIKSIITAMPRASLRSHKQREFAGRWINPKTARRQGTRAAAVSAGLLPPPNPKTPAYDDPLEVQLPFWRLHSLHLPLPLRFYDDDKRINERLAETMIAIRRLRPPPGVFHSDSQSRRSQWVTMVVQTFAHPTEDLFGLLQAMGVTVGEERDWLTGDTPRFSQDVDHATPLDVLAFFAMSGLTPAWVGRLREFAVEYLAAHSSAPEFVDGIGVLLHDVSALPDAIPTSGDPPPAHAPPSVKENNDIAMWSAEDDLASGPSGGGKRAE